MTSDEIDPDDDGAIEAVLAPPPQPEFRNSVVAAALAAIGAQRLDCLCTLCPAAHWEAVASLPTRSLGAPLERPDPKDKNGWSLRAFCRVKHQEVASLVSDLSNPGALKPEMGSKIVFMCSDYEHELAVWQGGGVSFGA